MYKNGFLKDEIVEWFGDLSSEVCVLLKDKLEKRFPSLDQHYARRRSGQSVSGVFGSLLKLYGRVRAKSFECMDESYLSVCEHPDDFMVLAAKIFWGWRNPSDQVIDGIDFSPDMYRVLAERLTELLRNAGIDDMPGLYREYKERAPGDVFVRARDVDGEEVSEVDFSPWIRLYGVLVETVSGERASNGHAVIGSTAEKIVTKAQHQGLFRERREKTLGVSGKKSSRKSKSER